MTEERVRVAAELERLGTGPTTEAARKLGEATLAGLDALLEFFETAKGYDRADLKAQGLINRTATDVIARQIRVNEGQFQAAAMDEIGALLREIAAAKLAKPGVDKK